MFHELGLGGGAGGEVEEQGFVRQGGRVGGEVAGGGIGIRVLQRLRGGGAGLSAAAAAATCAAAGAGVGHFDKPVVAGHLGELAEVRTADGGPARFPALHPVLQVRGTHESGGGDQHDAKFDAGQHEFPQFHLVAQHDDHAVAALHALAAEPVGHLVGPGRQFGEAASGGRAVLFHDHQRRLGAAGRIGGDGVKPVECEVELRRPRPFEAGPRLAVVLAHSEQLVACGTEVVGDCHTRPFAWGFTS